MRSPTDPPDPREEPGEIVEAFRTRTPVAPLDPPPGMFENVRRRAAGRRRRRAFAVATAVAACLTGTTAVIALTAPGDADPTTAAPPVATESAPPTERSFPSSSPSPTSEPETSQSTENSPESPQNPENPDPSDASDPSESSEATESSPEETGTTPTCATSQLDLVAGTPNSGAGSVFVPLEFTNTGDETCAILGYPGVSLVSADTDEQIGAPATRGPEHGEPTMLELSPGDTATADLRITRAENYPTETCDPAPTSGLRVYPPNQRASLFLPYENVTGCANEEVTLLSVTVVYEGE
jgi:hypothetical protein